MTDALLEPLGSAPRSAWQFRLSHLFWLTTIAAVAAALVAAVGPGTLLTSGGIFVAWLNRCGVFASLQASRRQTGILLLAWTTFLVSLALPSVTVFGPVSGADAAWIALAGPVVEIHRGTPIEPTILLYFAIDAANLLLAAVPVLIWRLRRGGGQWHSAALAVAMVSAWLINWDSPLLVGYYVWCGSFFLALVATRVTTWTLSGMAAATAGLAMLTLH